jgi:N-methylhydantoinase A
MGATGNSHARGARVGVDVGGTFTDLVAIRDGVLVSGKVASRPDDQSLGVAAALELAGLGGDDVAALAHGTTVATNALLERRGARTALVTTEGFRDVIEIGRQNRPSLYDLAAAPPSPLVPRELRFTVTERIGPEGVELALDEASVEGVVDDVRSSGVQAVAVCLLFSFADPSHERRIRDALASALPDVRCSLSSDVLPEFREYERFATTTADAYLRPVLSSYLDRLESRLRELGLPAPLVMQSSGGVTAVAAAAARPSTCVLSGPAAGVVAAAYVAGESGFSDLLTFDMGGTSTDVSLVLGGEVQTTTGSIVAGVPIKHPMVDVHTVSAGGGSIAWVDSGGAVRVGPRSAGADPGPAAYGLGGTDATVTDANVVLGYLADGMRLGDGIVLERRLAERAIGELADRAALDPLPAAAGVVAVAEAEMARALRVISVQRGVDPRGLTLVAFGGAGGLHACRLAEELGMTCVLVPRAAGVLSALGLAVSDLRRDYVTPLFADARTVRNDEFEAAFASLEQRAQEELDAPSLQRSADARYQGQSFELTVPAPTPVEIGPAFLRAHLDRYGYTLDDTPIELVALRLSARQAVPRPALTAAPDQSRGDGPRRLRRNAFFDGSWVDAPAVELGDLAPGTRLDGPAIVALPEATCVVRPGWVARIDDAGALVVTRR